MKEVTVKLIIGDSEIIEKHVVETLEELESKLEAKGYRYEILEVKEKEEGWLASIRMDWLDNEI